MWVLIALKIPRIKDLYNLCRTMKHLYRQVYQSRNFRLQWLSTQYPQYVDFIYSRNKPEVVFTGLRPLPSPAEMQDFVTEPAHFLADATRLRVRLPRSIIRAHFMVWLRELQGHVMEMPIDSACERRSQVIPNMLIYGWHVVIPWYLRNQLVPPPLNSGLEENDWVQMKPPDKKGLRRVGPDFETTLRWLGIYCGTDPDYSEYGEYRDPPREKCKYAILDAGFFHKYQRYDGSFFPDGWERGLVYMVFNELPEMWQCWIQYQGKDKEWTFDIKGMIGMQKDLLGALKDSDHSNRLF